MPYNPLVCVLLPELSADMSAQSARELPALSERRECQHTSNLVKIHRLMTSEYALSRGVFMLPLSLINLTSRSSNSLSKSSLIEIALIYLWCSFNISYNNPRFTFFLDGFALRGDHNLGFVYYVVEIRSEAFLVS